MASAGYRFGDATTLQGSVGTVVDGKIETGGVDYDVRPGFLTSFSLSHGWLGERKTFLISSFSAGVSTGLTESAGGSTARLTATDFRVSLMLGYTFADVVSPFVLVRGFGGPVFWDLPGDSVVGGDRNHYAVGAGVVVRASAWRFSLSGSAAGERSVSAGVSYAFAGP